MKETKSIFCQQVGLRSIWFLTIILSQFSFGFAQYPRNYSISNYSGVVGGAFNPASLADSRQKLSIQAFSLGLEAENNFVNVRTPYSQWKALRGKVPDYQLDENGIPLFYTTYIEDRLNTNSKQAYLGLSVGGPGFTMGFKNKSAIGFSTNTRSYTYLRNLNEDLLKIFLEDFDTTYSGWTPNAHQERYIGKPNNQVRFGAGTLAYQEFNFSYAGVLIDEKQHFLKGGVTLKYLVGLAATYITANDLSYELLDVDSIRWKSADLNLSYISEDFYTNPNLGPGDFFGKNKLGSGSAIDVGVVYEFRPRFKEYYYRMDRKNVEDRTANKYLFKVGASISDFGRIKFNNTQYARQRNIIGDSAVDWDRFKRVQSFNGSDDVDSFLFTLFPKSDSTDAFSAKLPASFNVFVDFQLAPSWFVSTSVVSSLRGSKVSGTRKQNTVSVGGRYETKQLEFGTNLVFGRFYNPVHLGAHMRVGPLFLGTDNLGGIFTAKSTNGFNLFMGLQFPILYKKIKDSDFDMVSDEKDECPYEFGSEKVKGCPDMDDDRVADSEDRCPDVPGEKKTHGCPDPDGDQLAGLDDKCPDKAGLPENQGCPDTDEDSLPDHVDRCPDEAGSVENFGCPDAPEEEEEVEEEVVTEEVVTEEIDVQNVPKNVTTEPVISARPTAPKTDKVLTTSDVVNLMDFNNFDYYLILGAYKNKDLADKLAKRLKNEAGVYTYIYYDEANEMNYVTFGRTTGIESANEQLKLLDKPKVNALINGHVWWKKVAK